MALLPDVSVAPRPRRVILSASAGLLVVLAGCPGAGEWAEQGPHDVGAVAQDAGAARDPFPTLAADRICPSSGYLCDFLLARGEGSSAPEARRGAGAASDPGVRVARWPDDTRVLQIRVDLPPVPDADQAREFQRAAVRGLLAWDGQPFRLQIQDRDTGGGPPAHVHVAWRERLGPGQAGRVTTRWELRGTSFRFKVVSFELALEVPPEGGGRTRSLTPDDLERVAAHEMGHALGLGHSDAPEDLMYPLNTARALSPRDYRTMDALYRLPAGARVMGSARP